MARLNIRNLPDEVHQSLRVRAARAGRSMEAEAREIITLAVMSGTASSSPGSLQDFVTDLYKSNVPKGVVDDLIAERRREAKQE